MESFVNTLNNMGYMSQTLDIYAQEFIRSCTEEAKIFEAGAAFGVSTLPILKSGAKVVVNDLCPQHLAILWRDCPSSLRERLTLAPGPIQTLDYETGSFDGIFTSRMLHLLKGSDIEMAMGNFFRWLKPGGTLVAVVDTPFLKCYSKNIPLYEERKAKGELWPGLIDDTIAYKKIVHNNIPDFINFLDLPTLERIVGMAGFVIEKSSYISQKTFPHELKLDGRESAGIRAIKPLE